MNIVLNFLLLVFFGVYCGYSTGLICYTCQNCADPADLNGYTNNTCPGPCMKVRTYIPTMGVYIYKACTARCTEESRYFGFATFDVTCCNDTNRCNTAPPSTFSKSLFLTFVSITLSVFAFY